jgi:2-dehydropantoate 2-reductase
MNIAIVGLGGVGGYIGAQLTKTSHHITFITRAKDCKVILKNGITVIEDNSTYSVFSDDVTDKSEIVFDLIFLTVKSYDINNAISSLKSNISKHTIIIPLSNGVEHTKNIKNLCNATVLNSCVYILAHLESKGVVRKKGETFALIFGNQNETANIIVSQLLDEAQLRYKNPKNYEVAVWKKYIFITTYASLTSYHDKSIYRIVSEHLEENRALLKEINEVAKAMGIDIEDEIEKSIKTALKLPHDASTSMHLDFQKKRKTELETLSGYMIKMAKQYKVEVPIMLKIYSKLKSLENSMI